MATKKINNLPEDEFALYERLVASIPAIELKGATMPYTSWQGHMFSFLDAEGHLGLRLPAPEREEFILQHHTRLCVAHGKVLKEYVFVPDQVFKNLALIKTYFAVSFDYVRTLKPKSAPK